MLSTHIVGRLCRNLVSAWRTKRRAASVNAALPIEPDWWGSQVFISKKLVFSLASRIALALEVATFRLTVLLFLAMLLPAILNLPATGATLKGLPSNMGLSPVPNRGKLTIPAMVFFSLICLSEALEANLMMIFSYKLGDNV